MKSLTRTGYCEACGKTLHTRRDEEWHVTIVECRNTRCWRGVARHITDRDWLLLDPHDQMQLLADIERCAEGGMR